MQPYTRINNIFFNIAKNSASAEFFCMLLIMLVYLVNFSRSDDDFDLFDDIT